jgi:isopenicillin-N epimerase
LHEEFDWTGTDDPSAWASVGEAIGFLDSLLEGGIEAVMQSNRQLALTGQRILCERLGLAPSCPDAMHGSMAALRLGEEPEAASGRIHPLRVHPLQQALQEQFGIEVPVYNWPGPPHLMLRISAHAYNSPAQYEQLADALEARLAGGRFVVSAAPPR